MKNLQTPEQTSRYAVYLVPPFPIAWQIMTVHQLLEKQFGLRAAGRFQTHITMKGFFKKNDNSLEELIVDLDKFFQNQSTYPVHFGGYHIDEVGIGLDVSQKKGEFNEDLSTFREKLVDVIRPYIADDCDFVESDLGVPFKAHLTLAFRDIQQSIYDDVIEFVDEAKLATEPFTARSHHLVEFHSENWNGNWERTLTWKLLKTWRIV